MNVEVYPDVPGPRTDVVVTYTMFVGTGTGELEMVVELVELISVVELMPVEDDTPINTEIVSIDPMPEVAVGKIV